MGLLRTGIGTVTGVLSDQWKEYFYCDALGADVLAVKGRRARFRRVQQRAATTSFPTAPSSPWRTDSA